MGIPEDIADFEQNLNDLIIKYEQYFLGMEKRAPLKLLARVERESRQYANVPIFNTMHKFKYQSLVSRLCSYKQYWERINRLIEDGKYSRERFKMEMHRKETAPEPSRTRAESPPEPPHAAVYRAYVDACRSCNLPVDSVTPDKFFKALERQKPAIIAKYNCPDVEFKVVIEQGAPKVKARPRQ